MKRQKIDLFEAVQLFRAYSIEPQVFNGYQLRLYDMETRHMYDWYHTTGSLVSYAKSGAHMILKKEGIIRDFEDVAQLIRNREDMLQ